MINEFENPTNEYRGKPFWAWNGVLDKEELLRQVHIMKEMGFGGFFMHSRIGLGTEYLGEKWFDCVNACSDLGKELGMEVWLYDEDRWPSGTAGGGVTVKKENRMKFIRMNTEGFSWDKSFISAFLCEIDGINFKNKRKLEKNSEIKDNETVLWFDIIEFPEGNFYNGNTYVDTMKKEAVQDFITSTHEKYKEKCNDRVGNVIKGIFTDEPHRGYVMCDIDENGIKLGESTPYTDSLFEDFSCKYGYSLQDNLPELFLRKDAKPVSPIKWHYMELIEQLFIDNYMKPILKWCHNNNMLFTGHLLQEDMLSSQAITLGSLMRGYEYMDIPGVDVLLENTDNYCIVKQLSSVARQCGKKQMLSELYGCTGWQMDFESHKNIGDWQALLGINLRCPHLSWYTMEGEAKRDYPASILHQSTWYQEYKYVEDYFSRLGVFNAFGYALCDYLVINPVESMWCQIHKDWSVWLCGATKDVEKIENHYKRFYNLMLAKNIDFDYGDEEMLSRLSKIEDGYLCVGKARYKKVIITGMTTIRSTTLKILNDFVSNNGEVIVIGDKPQYVDAVESDISIKATKLPFEDDTFEKIRQDNLVNISCDDVFTQVREDKNNKYIMILNTNRKFGVTCDIQINTDGYFELWDAKNGTKKPIKKPTQIKLPAGGELLIVVTNEKNEVENDVVLPIIPLTSPKEYHLHEKNVLVLDYCECEIDTEKWEKSEVLKVDRRLREKFALDYRSGNMLQPWYINKNTSIKDLSDITLKFTFQSEIEIFGELVLEQAQKYEIMVNYELMSNKPTGKWIDICFDKIPILIKKGENTITLKGEFNSQSNIEALYIIGDFGVFDNVISPLPKYIGYGKLSDFGLPFYTGKITFDFDISVKETSKIKLPGMFNCACVKVNESIIAYSPYEAVIKPCEKIEITLVPTRRNLFGPLHQTQAKCSSYGPWNFITEGEDWTDNYVTLPIDIEKGDMNE